MTKTPATSSAAPKILSGVAGDLGFPNHPKWSKMTDAMIWPAITAANQGREPTRGTKISDAVRKTTPIDPPVQIHQGKSEGAVLNEGGKIPSANDKTINKVVPLPNEIREAWNGWRTFNPSEPLMLGWAPSKHPAASPTATASRTMPGVCKGLGRLSWVDRRHEVLSSSPRKGANCSCVFASLIASFPKPRTQPSFIAASWCSS